MRRLLLATTLLALMPATANAQLPLGLPDLTIPAARETEPVVLKGAQLAGWSGVPNATLRLPLMDLLAPDEDPHNGYATPELDSAKLVSANGVPTDRLLGYRWSGERFEQIPFQVDEVFTRYLNNAASGFAIYSGEDQHTTYAYDREGFRYTRDGPPDDPCRAQPAGEPATDPVKGLDNDDELAFMASDAGPQAPSSAPLPAGIEAARAVRIVDGTRTLGYVYVMKAAANGPRPAFTAANGYVRYQRDADADLFAFSQSSYSDYGNAATGIYCDADGNVVMKDGKPAIGRRRPRDTATVRTGRYRFRYDGRWLMTSIRIKDGHRWGPDLVDRWKARAFAQDPASETPCCGYEEEDTNWGGSSTLLGERTGPVRAIRETWGADSGTNVIRRETFYRDEMVQRSWLRVHPIPPLDGIYAQWDFNAGVVDRFFSATKPGGVVIDGRNDDVFNLDDPCNVNYDHSSTAAIDQSYRTLYRQLQLCQLPYHLSIDPSDPTFSAANAALSWSMVTGDHGTIVDRLQLSEPQTITAGGLAQSLLAVPYYRDDSCFDDGTGTDPGPKLRLRSGDEPRVRSDGVTPRRCWTPKDGRPEEGSDEFFQGSIATHGMHLLALAESDNARLTVPLDEITADWRLVMLPGRRGARDGERYGRRFEKPLVAVVAPR